MSAAKPPLSDAEVVRILRLLAPVIADRQVVMVGGQAVSLWAGRLLVDVTSTVLANPLASKDLDFESGVDAVRRAAALLGGVPRIASWDDHTSNTGVVLFDDGDGIKRRIDFLLAPYGLDAADVRKTAIQLSVGVDPKVSLWVMHPERCMEPDQQRPGSAD
jgi:hypothetical protein